MPSRRSPRPEKCWASTAVTRTPRTSWPSSQSHSTTRDGGTPQASRCAPTPSGTRNTACVVAHECPDGVHVEVVVVVVRDDDGVDAAEPRERHRHGVQPARPDVLARRAPLAPHRVHQQPHPVELDEARGVPEPRDVHPLGARLVRRAHDRDRQGGATRLGVLPEAPQHVALPRRHRRRAARGVVEGTRPVGRRLLHPGQARPRGSPAQRGVDPLARGGERPEGAGGPRGDRESVELGHRCDCHPVSPAAPRGDRPPGRSVPRAAATRASKRRPSSPASGCHCTARRKADAGSSIASRVPSACQAEGR